MTKSTHLPEETQQQVDHVNALHIDEYPLGTELTQLKLLRKLTGMH